MKVTRRNFLKWASIASVGAVACNFFPDREMQMQSSVDLPEDLVTGRDAWFATLCGICPEREGIVVRVMEGRAKKIQGNPMYPTNAGKQSVRCDGALQTLYHPDRITRPMERIGPRGSGLYAPTSWNAAMNTLGGKLKGLQAAGNSQGMLMVTEPLRGHLGMVVDRFATTFGGRHLGLEPMGYSVLKTTTKGTFGQDPLPHLDIENSRYLLSFGADFLSTWLSPTQQSREYGNFRSNREDKARGTFVQIDPRYSMTAASSDEWLPIIPGMDGVVALSIACIIVEENLEAPGMVERMTGGASREDLLAALDPYRPEKIVDPENPLYVGIPSTIRDESATDLIRRISREFARSESSLAIGGGEAEAQTNGTFNLSAIYALNYLVGGVGRGPDGGGVILNPASPIGELNTPYPVGTNDDWTEIAGNLRSGQLKVLMAHGANPAYSLPIDTGFARALEGAPDDTLVVSFASLMTDTAQMSDLILPVRAPLEDWGDDVPDPGPGFQVIGFQQPVVNPLPEIDPRSFPDLLLSLSDDLGMDDGLSDSFEQVLKDGAQKLFDLGSGSPAGGSADSPNFTIFWNQLLQQGGWWDTDGRATAAPAAPPNLLQLARQLPKPRFEGPSGGDVFYLIPFLHNSLLDGRGAYLPWLQAAPDPLTTVTWQTWIEISVQRAKEMGLKEGDMVSVVSTEGSIEAVVYPHPAVPPDMVGIPVGQGHLPGVEYATRDGETRGANVLKLLSPLTDSETGALAWAATRVRITPTGRNIKVSKFEGIVTAFPIGTREVDPVQVTRGEGD